MNVCDAALRWYDAGIVPIPCWPQSKRAVVRWARWQAGIPARRTVTGWFSRPWNLALMCGRGLVVLDFDDVALYGRWRADRGELAATYTVATARGMHAYYRVRHPPATSAAWPGLDVKASGYVLGAGSVHPSGVRYRAIAPAHILEIDELREVLPEVATYGADRERGDQVRAQTPQIRGPLPPDRRLYPGAAALARERVSVLNLVGRWTSPFSSDGGRGRWWMARCPNPGHEDRHPSFRIDATCGQCTCLVPGCALYEPRGMDAIELYSRMHDVDTREAIACLLGLAL